MCCASSPPQPPPTPEQAVVWLGRTLEIHGHVLEADRKERVGGRMNVGRAGDNMMYVGEYGALTDRLITGGQSIDRFQAFLAKEAALQVEQAQEYAKATHVRTRNLAAIDGRTTSDYCPFYSSNLTNPHTP